MRRLALSVALALLCLTLSAPVVSAAAPKAGQRRYAAPSTLQAMGRLWHALRNVWGANGSSIDPFGKAGTTTPPPPQTTSSDNGSTIDPFGVH